MLGMMGKTHERGAMMGSNAVRQIVQDLLGNIVSVSEPTSAPGDLNEAGGAVMAALKADNKEAFTAALQRFVTLVDELEDEDDGYDLEMG